MFKPPLLRALEPFPSWIYFREAANLNTYWIADRWLIDWEDWR